MENVATSSGFIESVPYLSGFLFVLLVLFTLWLVIEGIGLWFRSQEQKNAAALAAQEHGKAHAQAVQQLKQLPEEHLVVITAAVTMMLGSQHRLVSIRNVSASWGQEGRRELLHSHSFR
ncbi:hypothetical protein CSA57_00055 [candidate division KSB3 bacterium]|nr:MAG: hypothetical protein CSA57_00055 [candidate division KSB3 bacterium]